jgi:hypothetical protein
LIFCEKLYLAIFGVVCLFFCPQIEVILAWEVTFASASLDNRTLSLIGVTVAGRFEPSAASNGCKATAMHVLGQEGK